MKIVIDARMYGTEHGGIGRYVVNLVDQLQKIDNVNNYVLLLRERHFNQLNVPLNWEKVLVDVRHYSFNEQIAVAHCLRKIEFDLVHFPHFNVPVLYRGKYIVTVHDLLMHKRNRAATSLPKFSYFVKRAGYKLVFERAVRGASRIVVPTRFVKDEVEKVYPGLKGKVVAIYEGVDENVFAGRPGGYLRRNKIEKPYFLYAGNIYPHKNVERLVEAGVAAKTNLVIVTPRNIFLKRLEEFVKKHNAGRRVRFTGYVSDRDLSTLYKNAAAFVYPSLEEGFGLQGLEAMANRCLLLASDIPVFKEVYKENAIYFNPLDFSSIAEKMKEALNIDGKRKEELTSKAFEFVKGYSWEKTAKETLGVYEGSDSL